MASISQVSIELQVKGEREATQALKRYTSAGDKLKRNVLDAANKLKSSEASWDRANKLYKEGTLNLNGLRAAQTQIAREIATLNGYVKTNGDLNTQKALSELRAMEATKKATAAEAAANAQRKQAQASYNQLRASIDSSYAARMRIKQASETLRRAVEAEIISTQEASQMLRQYGNVARSATAYTAQTARKTNQLGVVFQQAGYQIGDFAVQVQSGTHYMVALGQQMTQLIGVGAMISKSTKWIAAFSVLGIIVPIATAIAGGFMRASGAASTLQQSIESLSSTVSDYVEASKMAEESTSSLSLKFGDQAVEIKELVAAVAEFKRLKLLDEIETSLGKISSAIDVGIIDSLRGFASNAEGQLRKIQHQFSVSEDQAASLQETFNNFRSAQGIDGAVSAAIELHSTLIEVFGSAENIPKPLRDSFLAAAELAREAAKAKESVVQLDLSAKNMFNTMQRVSGLDISGAFNDAANSVSMMNSRLDSTLSKVSGLLSALGQIGFDTVAYQAEAAALEAGKTSGQATIEGQLARRAEAGATELELTAMRSALEARLAAQTRLESARGTSGSSGSSAAAQAISDFEQLKRSLDEAYAAQIKYNEGQATLDAALKSGQVTLDEYNRLLDLLGEKYGDASNAANSMNDDMIQIAGTMREQMSQAFMSIVDGSKSAEDAFKDMARAVLKQAFELLVIKPIMDSLFGSIGGSTTGGGGLLGGLFNANGNAFRAGNVVPFATGGVVTSATAFPMAGGRTGVMGEAGPEAIMPLKRGKGGKLGVQMEGGSNAPVNVYQTFQFSANGDDSVKRIIADSAPQIAELTKRQIYDERSRGGQAKAVFG